MGGSSKSYEYTLFDGGVRIERCAVRTQNLVIPEFIDDAPVTAIAPYAFEGNTDVREITCPPQAVEIGSRAFANCPELERITFPADLACYDNSWIAGCTRLEEIVLPGAIVDLDLPSPAPAGVRRICIGQMTRTVQIARTWKTKLDQVRVDSRNRWLSADGACIYSADGAELISHATKSSEVDVASGCRRVATRAFEHEKHIECIRMPESVSEIGERAFSESSLHSFEAPSSLRIIGREAFAGCRLLTEISFSEGLREIGERAFAECTGCTDVHIPASVVRVGRKAFEGAGLKPCGSNPTLVVNANNPNLFIDGTGVLCERAKDGVVVLEALDAQTKRYRTPDGTVRVGMRAFFEHPCLEQLEITEGVSLVEPEAFMGCERLRVVKLPSSLRRLEARAFATTSLISCRIPAGVEHLGECALAFNYKNWHPTTNPPETRAHVVLESGNDHYFVKRGLLYERGVDGAINVVLYVGPDIDVVISQDACSIAPYAFFGVQGIRELRIPARMQIGEATFAMRKPPALIVLEGEDGISLEAMRDWRGVCAMQRAYAGDGTTDGRLLCATFDEEALGAQLDYEAYRYMLMRLLRPNHLEPSKRRAFESVLCGNLEKACIAFAHHDDRKCIDGLADIGLISAENIDRIVEVVSAEGSAPIMARLYELKRMRFQMADRDYSL